MLRRPRLLDVMASRLGRTATVISAGAGFGKSTLLKQAVNDPVTIDRVRYITHRVSPTDPNGDELFNAIATDLRQLADLLTVRQTNDDHSSTTNLTEVSLADQIWHLSPVYITVIVDDIHLLAPGGSGWETLNDLVLNLPDNADVIYSGRGFHELTLSRLLARGEAIEMDEATLAFTSEEIDEFARLRNVERTALDDHGWPALVELEAQAGIAGAHEFVAEEVLAGLAPERVRALRCLAVHDRVDDELVHVATEFTGSARELFHDLPLTTSAPDGTWMLHDLWRGVLTADLDQTNRAASLSAGAALLHRRNQLREAVSLAVQADDDELTLSIVAELARDLAFVHSIGDRRFVLDALPPSLLHCAEAELLRADIVVVTEPRRAHDPLQRAIDVATEQDRPEVTVLALLRLGDMAYRSGDRRGLEGARDRLDRLHSLGGTGAAAAAVLTESWLLLLSNRAAEAVTLMGDDALRSYPPVAAMADYYRAVQLGHAGRAEASLRALEDLTSADDSRVLERRGGFALLMRWWTGTLDETSRREADRQLHRASDDHQQQQHFLVEGAATAALWHASAGEVTAARNMLDRALAQRDRVPDGSWAAISVVAAEAVIALLDGDEAGAALLLDTALPTTGPFDGFARHVFGNFGALLYTLTPRARPFFDEEAAGSDLRLATDVGRALVAMREHGSTSLAAKLPWHELHRLRTWAFEPHLAELAIGAMSSGVLSAATALASLTIDPRGSLRAVAERHDGAVATLALEELDRTPSRPALVTHVRVLGATQVEVGPVPEQDAPSIRRKMVRELLLLLVHRRRLRRDEIAALMWPDKDENAARNNLRATLNHLRALLEHGPDDGPPWHIRSEGESLELFLSDRLVIDSVEFERAVSNARRADIDRRAGDALSASLSAIDLYRGAYLDDALDPDWGFNHRMKLHLDHVEMCTRASELLEARGDVAHAIALARRAVDAEPLSDRAHRALVRALATSGDRAGARRAHERCLELLAADGLTPEDETIRVGAQV